LYGNGKFRRFVWQQNGSIPIEYFKYMEETMKITKKIFLVTMVLTMTAGMIFAGGQGQGQQQTSGGSRYTIGVFTKDGTIAFWRYCMQGAVEEGKKLGVTVREYAPQSYTDVQGQISMVEDAIQSGVNAICIAAVDSTAILPALNKASQQGIAVIIFNTRVPDFKDQKTFIGVDNVEASRAVVKKYLEDVNYKANIAVIEGDPAGQQNKDRTKCLYEFSEQYPDVKLVAVQPGYANRERSMTVMENLLQTNANIDVVWAISDVAALGAAQAIQASGRKIPVITIDGTPEGSAATLDDRIKYTFDQSPLEQGAFAVRAAVDQLDGKTLQPFYPTGGTIVSKEIAPDFLKTNYPEFKF
jgi:ABC-type sugar transport system substrate-binding protein